MRSSGCCSARAPKDQAESGHTVADLGSFRIMGADPGAGAFTSAGDSCTHLQGKRGDVSDEKVNG
jgi:hypothetical protein